MNRWPSTRVPQGGILHPQKASYSKETHELLKVLMEEQKMTIMQRNKLEYFLRNGSPLPALTKQTSAKSNSVSRSSPFNCLRIKTARRRTLDVIKASGALDCEKYVPRVTGRETCEQQKLRFQEKMSGLKYFIAKDALKFNRKQALNAIEDIEPVDPVDELHQEIQERIDWLQEMEELGEGKKYNALIHDQIAERRRQIEQIKKKREQNST